MGSSLYSDANALQQAVAPGTVMTVNTASAAFVNNILSGMRALVNVSAVSGTTPSLVVSLQAYNPLSGTWVDVAASAAITAVGDYVLSTSPLPHTWRLNFTLTGTTPSFTFGGVMVELFR